MTTAATPAADTGGCSPLAAGSPLTEAVAGLLGRAQAPERSAKLASGLLPLSGEAGAACRRRRSDAQVHALLTTPYDLSRGQGACFGSLACPPDGARGS